MLGMPSRELIGADQFSELFKSTPLAIKCQLVNATIMAIALWSVADTWVISGWWTINLAVSLWTLTRWHKNRHRTIKHLSRKSLPRAVFSGFLYALPWSLLVILYLGNLPHHQELLLGVAVAGLAAAGSVQLAGIYPAALSYLATILVPVFIKSLFLGGTEYYLLAVLSCSYIFYLISIIASTARNSVERSSALRETKSKVIQLDEMNDTLEKLATLDELTGLPNRRFFNHHLDGSISKARDVDSSFFLVICDLDNFKYINDVLGHAAGDELLKIVADRLRENLNSDDFVSRIGGDEFSIVIKSQKTKNGARVILKKLLKKINVQVDVAGNKINPGISIGISSFPEDAKTREALLSHADMAMQHGKKISRGQFWFFDQALRSKLLTDSALEVDLRNALENQQFELFYQPKVDINTGQLRGFESLLRWRRPDGKLKSPAHFFSVAEERGLMLPISDVVLDIATRDMRAWQDIGLDPGSLSINIHPVQMRDQRRMRRLSKKIIHSSLQPEKIIFEITEECFIGRGTDDVPDTLKLLRDQNFKISLDDFGTGYASLTHLKVLPVDEIKLDRSFVNGLNSDASDRSIVHAMINLGNSLGLSVVAEGIENREHHNILLAMGCEIGQGHHYGKPMTFFDATQYLQQIADNSPINLSERAHSAKISRLDVSKKQAVAEAS